MITLLSGIVSAQVWQRRKLRRVARRIAYEGELMLSAIRVTHQVRGSLDIRQTLDLSVSEVARVLNVEHCCIRFDLDDLKAFACSCGSSEHEFRAEAAFNTALSALAHEHVDRFLSHNYPNRQTSDRVPTSFPVLAIPITRISNGCKGTLLVLSEDQRRLWLESEIQMLLAVAHQLALSVDQTRLFDALEQQSLTDQLTGCLNRRAFDSQLESAFRAAEALATPVSLVLLDIDLFSDINDDHGHPSGDRALRTLARILLEEKVNGAVAARVGGDEFALIIPGRTLHQTSEVAERVRRLVELSNDPELPWVLTVSVGVASFPLHGSSPITLYAAADKALYHAKATGRNQVRVF